MMTLWLANVNMRSRTAASCSPTIPNVLQPSVISLPVGPVVSTSAGATPTPLHQRFHLASRRRATCVLISLQNPPTMAGRTPVLLAGGIVAPPNGGRHEDKGSLLRAQTPSCRDSHLSGEGTASFPFNSSQSIEKPMTLFDLGAVAK